MNRLSPLITRASARYAPTLSWTQQDASEPASDFTDDLKLFAIGWLGGLVFFGTLLA
jgi:hypothetical protein